MYIYIYTKIIYKPVNPNLQSSRVKFPLSLCAQSESWNANEDVARICLTYGKHACFRSHVSICLGCLQISPYDERDNTARALHKMVSSSPIRNFAGHLFGPSKLSPYRVASETRKKSTWTTRTNGGIQLGSRRLNEDRKRVGSRTRVEARPQSETNRREEGQACQHSRWFFL